MANVGIYREGRVGGGLPLPRATPTLRGRVSVKFVIDRSAAVSTAADAGSDRAVIACIVHAFGNLSFPQPEGGGVPVVYPLLVEPSP